MSNKYNVLSNEELTDLIARLTDITELLQKQIWAHNKIFKLQYGIEEE